MKQILTNVFKTFVRLATSVSTKSIIMNVFVLKAGKETIAKEVSIIVSLTPVSITATVLLVQKTIRAFVKMDFLEEIVK